MVEALAMGGVGIYAFYALQPYLLELYGDPEAYQIAGLVAAIVAGAQILGGVAAPRIRQRFHRRTSALIVIAVLNVVTLGLIGLLENFWAVLGLIVVWGLLFAAAMPIRQAYLNGLIPSRQRATILSFDSLMGSCGWGLDAAVLGRAADVWGYAPSYLLGARDLYAGRAVPRALQARERSSRHARSVGAAGRAAGANAARAGSGAGLWRRSGDGRGHSLSRELRT